MVQTHQLLLGGEMWQSAFIKKLYGGSIGINQTATSLVFLVWYLALYQSLTGIVSLYDCVFKRRLDYNQISHRDDREHAKSIGLCVNKEERERPVGVLTSSVYGKRIHLPVEPLNRDHGRVNHVKADFYRKNDIPSIKAPGFGHISPV
ncbi:uncharacterized protein C5orf49 homolog isoform X2 [Elephas maximus indicus]|uniref:uncharacterized protein C5orf49 homolog isoform X2 n=1 Tax=Elephas maximus indicus TaxID=99487 RepID=UPI0021164E53|nr:uncharacterized protein C5orf49 homolog isoform X2 [Elephas maximus indicus]XP_049716787.1 uncharacterized protein C5orf49 homolog isoform X2 [Elephas maximus indicus]